MKSSEGSVGWLARGLREYFPFMLSILLTLAALPGFAQEKQKYDNGTNTAVLNGEVRTVMKTDEGNTVLRGRVSGYLTFTEESLEKGAIMVEALNWVVFGIDQESVTGKRPEGKPTSALGFSLATAKLQGLRYEDHILKGKLRGQLSMDQFFELTSPKDRGKGHDLDMRTLPAVMEIVIPLERPLKPAEQGVETRKVKAEITIRADAFEPLHIERALELQSEAVIGIQIDWTRLLEAARKLCIQPVRIGTFRVRWKDGPFGMRWPSFSFSYSGDGLAFGTPGLNTEWAKADIVFDIREWMTIYNSSYSTLTAGEMSSLRNEVNEDDCIEVFFVDRFDPRDMDGGGNTVSGGTESAKIISSDENADFGVDLTHLAHEVGHVLTLKHPGSGFPTPSAPHRVDGTSGTLMCPSGFNNDNPTVNSEDNEDNAANPLLQFSLKLRSAGPDCTDDADCGPCP